MRPRKIIFNFIIVIIFNLFFINQNFAASQNAGKICYSCSPEYIPGSPVSGDNKSLSELVILSRDMLSDKDVLYMTDLGLICSEYYDETDAKKTLKKQTIPDLIKYSPNQKLENSFLEDGCIPRKIGNALSPIAHLAAEVPVSRLGHLKAIQSYFSEQGKPEFFKKVINAKNTTGYTTLDYVQYMNDTGVYSKEYENGINNFIQYLCNNGGEYSKYKSTKKCDGQKMVVK